MADEVKKTKNDVTPVEFKLKAEHTHKGENFNEGDKITLCKYQAVSLQEKNVGTIVNG